MTDKTNETPQTETPLTYAPGRTPRECADEIRRELSVRQRCYPTWVEQGRLSRTEARDRLGRMEGALAIVERVAEHTPEPDDDSLPGTGHPGRPF